MTWTNSDLEKLTDEVASCAIPDMDWDSIERRVIDELDRPEARVHRLLPLPERRGSAHKTLAIAATASAMAASVALFAANASHSVPNGQAYHVVPTARHVAARQETNAKPRRIVATSKAMSVSVGGRAFIEALPHSTLLVVSETPMIRLRLTRGRVHVRVSPNHGDDVLSVRVNRSVVTVHGTEFTVSRVNGKMVVELQHGSVAIGEQGRRSVAERWLMHAPSKGTFSVDGAKQANIVSYQANQAGETLPCPKQVDTGSSRSKKKTSSAVSRPGHDPSGTPRLSEAALRQQVLQSLRAKIQNCYERLAFKPHGGLSVKVSTRVRIVIASDGHVRFAKFSPPMSPRPQECASEAVRVAKFPPSSKERQVELSLSF